MMDFLVDNHKVLLLIIVGWWFNGRMIASEAIDVGSIPTHPDF